MKILFVSTQIPYPPNNGVRIKLYHALRLVSSKHQTALLVLSNEPAEIRDEQMRHLKEFCEDITVISLPKRRRSMIALSSLIRCRLFFMEHYRDKAFRATLNEIINKWSPDVVHFDTIPLSQYGSDPDFPVATVLSPNDSYALNLENEIRYWPYLHLWQGFYRICQYLPARRYEAKVYPRFDICHFVSNVDGSYISKLNSKINVVVVPNGVDINYFKPPQERKPSKSGNVIYVGDVGGMSSTILKKFLMKTWRRVREKAPEANLNIIGKNPSAALAMLAADIGGVTLKGYVEDLVTAYTESLISVVPVRKNCGIINKAIESMAMGLVVVGFKEIYEGIPGTEHNVNCIAADSYKGLATEIVKLLREPEKVIPIGKTARDLIVRRYSWQSRKDDFCAMYEKAYELHKIRNIPS